MKNQVVLVTGSSKGIGKAIALKMADHGAKVIINGNNLEALEEVKWQITKRGAVCAIERGDVSDPETVHNIVESIVKAFGGIDVLVNNAGINLRSSTLETSIEDWNKVIMTNLHSNFYMSRAVLKEMEKAGEGNIINVSSSTSKSAHPNAIPAYGASKAAINYLTRHLALEFSSSNIRVNGVCPGPIETDMSKQWTPEYRKKVTASIPIGKVGEQEDVANAVLFLANESSKYITGETININGGTFMS